MKKWSCLYQERNLHQIKHRLQVKTALNKYAAGFWCERQQEMHFFTRGSVIIDYRLYLKTPWWICFSFCLLQMLTDGLEWCGLLVDYCDVFISCLDSHSDRTHSLQSIHWWDSDAMTHFSKSDEETNSSTSWITWMWGHLQPIRIFGWTIALKST